MYVGPGQEPPPMLGERPVSITGTDAGAYYAWLSGWADRVAGEWRMDDCRSREVGPFTAIVWPISEIPAYMDDDAAGHQMIVERVRVRGCGVDSVQNVGVFTGKDGRRWSVSLMQGEGRTSPRESTQRIGEAFGAAMPHFDTSVCPREEALRTMRIDPVTLPWGSGNERRWSELWPVSVCAVVMPVKMDFTRQADGSLDSEATWLEPDGQL
jgi:hypothetical protein